MDFEFSIDDDRPSKRHNPYEDGFRPTAPKLASTEDIDLDSAVAQQYSEAITYRDYVMQNQNMFDPKDITDAIKTVNTIVTQVVKLREQVQNMNRMRKFEEAVVAAVKELPKEAKDRFFATLEELASENS